ncbi:MAG: alpha-amylase family protein, partial [Arachnia sp.]
RLLDQQRLLRPDWLQDPRQTGYVAYADRFATSLAGVGDHLDHLADLGVTYLHLMPILRSRSGPNDGGYAVQDYQQIRPDLGTMADLRDLTTRLRQRQISLEVDLVLNHVAREHEWARRARAGQARWRDYFHVYPDRTEPDRYEQSLPEIFPDFAPGNFTWDPDLAGWVWTTFNDYQWDVNWANPDVFVEYVTIMCDLANHGVEIFRLDAIAFIWKQLGTNCQNQPQVHALTQAMRAALRVAAPAIAFKAEAIVGPRDLIGYFGTRQHHGKLSDLAYHNTLMAQLWSTLASRDATLMRHALRQFPTKPLSATWATYVRCHDDIGWAIDDGDAAAVGLDGFTHRAFLSDFYSGKFPGSFARGLVFQANPETGDRRISGSLASLAGLEAALQAGDQTLIDAAVARINLLHTVIGGYGGIPLIYMGDELGTLNDYGYRLHPAHADDNRWVHRPELDWAAVVKLGEHPDSPQARINAWLRHMLSVRRRTPQLHAAVEPWLPEVEASSVLAVRHDHAMGPMVQLYNFDETAVELGTPVLRECFGVAACELLNGHRWDLSPDRIRLGAYQSLWFTPA